MTSMYAIILPYEALNSSLSKASADCSSGNESSWHREMEKVQMETWFHPPVQDGSSENERSSALVFNLHAMHTIPLVVNSAFTLANMASTAFQTLDSMQSEPVNSQSLMVDSVSYLGITLEPYSAADLAATPTPSLNTAIVRLVSQATALSNDSILIDITLPAMLPSPSQSANTTSTIMPLQDPPRPEIRLHAELSPQGVLLWVGMDGHKDLIDQRMSLIVAELQRTLSEQGLCLESVICNGQIVFKSNVFKGFGEDLLHESEGAFPDRSQTAFSYAFDQLYQQET